MLLRDFPYLVLFEEKPWIYSIMSGKGYTMREKGDMPPVMKGDLRVLIREAADVLGLGEIASLAEIREQYTTLIKRWHPDACHEDPARCHEMTRRILSAYKIIMDYCTHYQFSFREEDIPNSVTPGDFWNERFGNDPIWG